MSTSSADNSIRWLHLSDFHIGKDDYAQREIFDEIISHVEDRASDGFDPDILFITGDIANRGLSEEYNIFINKFLSSLLEISQIDMGKVFTIPGNHDVIQSKFKFFDREEIRDIESRFFDPTPEGKEKRKQITPRFSEYIDNDLLIPNGWLESKAGCFDEEIQLNGISIGIVGTNTAWLSKEGDDRHQLSIGTNLLQNALNNVSECDAKIVLGHHPIGWLYDSHKPKVKSILGENNVIYLHGHLHRSRVKPEGTIGDGFLSVQSGAAFQARDSEKWANGVLWGKLDYGNSKLSLQPREWNRSNRDWSLGKDLPDGRRREGTDWWNFPLPSAARRQTGDGRPQSQPAVFPVGFQPIDKSFLDDHRETLEKRHALNFFDGAVPDWRIALSSEIPRLSVVDKTVDNLEKPEMSRPRVILLKGPVGEGKSTALRQTVDRLVENGDDWQVLFRVDESAELRSEEILDLPETGQRWLLVVDPAYSIAQDIYNACRNLKRQGRGDVSFLLASRMTDWKAAKANNLEWTTSAAFYKISVAGITREDASNLVDSWRNFGEEGLGALAEVDEEGAVRKLYHATEEGAENDEGALLGALLKVRYGDNLKEHIKVLMNRLEERSIEGGGNLLLAFSYIAAMHAEELDFLSRPVLAEALGGSSGKINANILSPLGMEAAASKDGKFILTRHRLIADAVMDLLEDVFATDTVRIFTELARSAVRAKRNEYVPQLGRWYYDITDHFLDKGRNDISIKIGKTILDSDPTNLNFRKHLSSVYRKSGAPGDACRLFRDLEHPIEDDRVTLIEWGISECIRDSQKFGAFVLSLALSDNFVDSPIKRDTPKPILESLHEAFELLHSDYLSSEFMKGQKAVSRLGLVLYPDATFAHELTQRETNSEESIDLEAELLKFREAATHAREYSSEGSLISKYVSESNSLMYNNFERLLENSMSANGEK